MRGELITWARQRSGVGFDELARRFPRLGDWESGDVSPTLKQLEKFANSTHTPVGFLFLPEPPDEELPLPDFRTMRDEAVRRASPDLLDTIFQSQQRQDWYRDYARSTREDPVAIVGSLTTAADVIDSADSMREALQFDIDERGASWGEALRLLIERAEALGVLVMVNGVVGSNTHRKLDAQEFRGFALVDDYAPVVFINGTDSKAAQIFTLCHELSHIWLGQSALDDADIRSTRGNEVERWCSQVAAELLVPLVALREDFRPTGRLTEELDRLANKFKVSTLVVLRRIHDSGFLAWDDYQTAYQSELARVLAFLAEQRGGSGGNFYNTQPVRTSKRFARALIASTLEGQTLHRDAFQLLGFKKLSTFQELAHRLGVI